MKKRKLLFLLIAVLCFAMLLVSCDEPEDPNPDPDPEEIVTKHEMLNWFVLDSEMGDTKVYSSVTQLGQIKEVGDDYTELPTYVDDSFSYVVRAEVDKYNQLVKTLTVYKNGEAVITKEAKVEYQGDVDKSFSVTVDEDYVAVKVLFSSVDEDDEDANGTYELDVYKISDTGSVLYHRTGIIDFGTVGNALFVKTKDVVEWVSEGGTVIFSASRDVYDTYFSNESAGSDAEYNGYVYWMNNEGVNVYAPAGASSVEYVRTPGAESLEAFVLNNGNVLIQEFTALDKWATDYDTIWNGEKTLVATKIINYQTGEVTVVENVDFVIYCLESVYNSEDSIFPLALAEGKDNQAYIVYMDKTAEPGTSGFAYVAIDNNAAVQYTFPVKAPNFAYELVVEGGLLVPVTEDIYIAPVYVGNDVVFYFFDLDGNPTIALGNIESFIGASFMTEDYIITRYAVYDWNMRLVYDFNENGIEWDGEVIGDKIVVEKDENYDEYPEWYFLDPATGALTLIADCLSSELCDYSYDYYVVSEYCEECLNHLKTCDDDNCDDCYYCGDCYNCKHTLYNAEGTALLVSRGCMDVQKTENGQLLVAVYFDNQYVCYVIE